MNIRVHLKRGKYLDFKLDNFSTMGAFYRGMDWTLETILMCRVILLINDISYIEEIPEKQELPKGLKVRP